MLALPLGYSHMPGFLHLVDAWFLDQVTVDYPTSIRQAVLSCSVLERCDWSWQDVKFMKYFLLRNTRIGI